MRFSIIVVISSLVLAFFCALYTYPDDNLRIIFCDVGQGDSILIQRAFLQVIVDGGPKNALLECLGKYVPVWDKTIEYIVVTHPQADHSQGFVELLRRYRVNNFVANGLAGETETYREILSLVHSEGSSLYQPIQGQRLKLNSEMEISFLWPEQKYGNLQDIIINPSKRQKDEESITDLNQVSLVFTLIYGDFSALFTGDIGLYEELALEVSGLLRDIDVLKVPHHGSKYSSSLGFLQNTQPEVSVISSGLNNSFGHPNSDTLRRLERVESRVMRTDKAGDVIIVSDGKKYWLE